MDTNTNFLLVDYLTIGELAAALGISPRTLDRWHRLGEGPARTRIGKRVVFRREAVKAWLARNEQESAA